MQTNAPSCDGVGASGVSYKLTTQLCSSSSTCPCCVVRVEDGRTWIRHIGHAELWTKTDCPTLMAEEVPALTAKIEIDKKKRRPEYTTVVAVAAMHKWWWHQYQQFGTCPAAASGNTCATAIVNLFSSGYEHVVTALLSLIPRFTWLCLQKTAVIAQLPTCWDPPLAPTQAPNWQLIPFRQRFWQGRKRQGELTTWVGEQKKRTLGNGSVDFALTTMQLPAGSHILGGGSTHFSEMDSKRVHHVLSTCSTRWNEKAFADSLWFLSFMLLMLFVLYCIATTRSTTTTTTTTMRTKTTTSRRMVHTHTILSAVKACFGPRLSTFNKK